MSTSLATTSCCYTGLVPKDSAASHIQTATVSACDSQILRNLCATEGNFDTIITNTIITNNIQPPGVATVITSFPNTGDGSVGNPITFAPASRPCQTFFWDGAAWRHNRNSGITEVTIGDIATGANFATAQEAIDLGCFFIRVVDNISEPFPLNIPVNGNVMIYIDPGINYRLAAGVMNVDSRSLTIRGSASAASSTIILQGQWNLDDLSRIYFYDCRVINATGGSMITTTSSSYGIIEANQSSFVAANAAPGLFGEAVANITRRLFLRNCTLEGTGINCGNLITSSAFTPSTIMLQGLRIIGDLAVGAPIANTIVSKSVLNGILISAKNSSQGTPFTWLVNGVVNNFRQDNDDVPTFVQLQIPNGECTIDNHFIYNITTSDRQNIFVSNGVWNGTNTVTLNGPANRLSNIKMASRFILAGAEQMITNVTTALSMTVSAANVQINNCTVSSGGLTISAANTQINNFFLKAGDMTITSVNNSINNTNITSNIFLTNSNNNTINNSIVGGNLNMTNSNNNSINNINVGVGFNLTNSSNNRINNSSSSSTNNIDANSVSNSINGGLHAKFTVDGDFNIFTGVYFQPLSTLTFSIGADGCVASSCIVNQISWAGADGLISHCDVDAGIGLSATQTSPRVVITGCRTGRTGNASGNINVNSNTNVVVTNCIVGVSGGLQTILNIVAGLPTTAGVTLVTNCKVAGVLPVSASVTNSGNL